MCNSILPPEYYLKNRIVTSDDLKAEKGITFEEEDKDIVINNENHFKRAFSVDEALKIPKSVDDTGIDVKELFERLKEYLAKEGISIEDTELAVVVAAFCSSRTLVVEDGRGSRELFSAINGFFGNSVETFIDHKKEIKQHGNLFGAWIQEENGDVYFSDSELLKGLYAASYVDSPYFIQIKDHNDIPQDEFDDFVVKYISKYEKLPLITISNIYKLKTRPKYIPQRHWDATGNIWFVISEENIALNPKSEKGYVFPVVTLSVAPTFKKTEENTNPIGVGPVLSISENISQKILLPENYWKVIDNIESHIASSVDSFRMDNQLLRGMETFSSVLLSLGFSEITAFDYMISCFMIPALSSELTDVPNWKMDISRIMKNNGLKDLIQCKSLLGD